MFDCLTLNCETLELIPPLCYKHIYDEMSKIHSVERNMRQKSYCQDIALSIRKKTWTKFPAKHGEPDILQHSFAEPLVGTAVSSPGAVVVLFSSAKVTDTVTSRAAAKRSRPGAGLEVTRIRYKLHLTNKALKKGDSKFGKPSFFRFDKLWANF